VVNPRSSAPSIGARAGRPRCLSRIGQRVKKISSLHHRGDEADERDYVRVRRRGRERVRENASRAIRERLFAIQDSVTLTHDVQEILIANRGEIALRVIYACKSSASRPSRSTPRRTRTRSMCALPMRNVCIGPPRSTDSYLNVPAIISAAEITGADGHSSRLRLSVRERVPRGSLRGGATSSSSGRLERLRLLGTKARARRAMKKAGVPILPGSDGPVEARRRRRSLEGPRAARHHSRPSPAAAAAACPSSAT